MSYDQLAESVDTMAQVQRDLLAQVKITEDTANAAVDAATQKVAEAGSLVVTAGEYAEAAKASSEMALIYAGVYPTTEAGLLVTPEGHYFSVPTPATNSILVLYLNLAGVAAKIDEYPNAAALQEALEQLNRIATRTGAIRRIPRGPLRVKFCVIAGGKYLSYTNDFGISFDNNPKPNYLAALQTSVKPELLTAILASKVRRIPRGPLGIRTGLIVGGKYSWYELGDGTYINPELTKSQGPVMVWSPIGLGQSRGLGSRGMIDVTVPGGALSGKVFNDKASRFGNNLLMLLPTGVRAYMNGENYAVPAVEDFTGLGPMYEQWDGNLCGETIWSGYARALYDNLTKTGDASYRLLPIVTARGGSKYPVIKKGTGVWTAMINAITAAQYLCELRGWIYRVDDMDVLHGESETDTPQEVYKGYMLEWLADFRTDVTSITKQSPLTLRCTYAQMNTGGTACEGVVNAQVELHETNKDFVLYAPTYQFKYYDGSHMIAEGYVKTGELRARAKRFMLQNKKWQPLRPVSAVLTGSTIKVTYNNTVAGDATTPGPIGALALDTNMQALGNVGMKAGFYLSNAGAVTITAVTLNPDQTSINVVLSAAPPAGTKLKYAMGEQFAGAVRDSDARDKSSFDGSTLYNFSIAKTFAIN